MGPNIEKASECEKDPEKMEITMGNNTTIDINDGVSKITKSIENLDVKIKYPIFSK